MKASIACVWICALLLASGPARPVAWGQSAQCATGHCRPSQSPRFEWRYWDEDPGRLYLYRNNVQIGGWDIEGRYFRPYDARTGSWGPATPAPTAAGQDSAPALNFGVDTAKIEKHPQYQLTKGGETQEVTAEVAQAAIEKRLHDDSHKLRVTVIGSEPRRKQVRQDLDQMSELKEWAIVRDYPPDHWAMRTGGFAVDGDPTIYCQAPSGKVLHRQDDYQGGIEEAHKALRRAKEAYDRKKDPDLRKPTAPNPLSGGNLPRLFGLLLSSVGGVIGGRWLAVAQR